MASVDERKNSGDEFLNEVLFLRFRSSILCYHRLNAFSSIWSPSPMFGCSDAKLGSAIS